MQSFCLLGNKLIIMEDFEKKFQNEITHVKGLKGGHTPGRVKVTAGTEDKIYLNDTITNLKSVVLQWNANYTSPMLDSLRIYVIIDTNMIFKSN